MYLWYGAAIVGSVLLLESFVNLVLKHEIRGNIIKACSGGGILILALLSLYYDWLGADIVVEEFNLWYAVASAGFVLFLEGSFSAMANMVTKHGARGDIIRAFSGFIAFMVGLIVLLITGG